MSSLAYYMQHLNTRLMDRQRKMVSLTTAVLDLWGRCQADPTFVKANSMKEDGGGWVGGVRGRVGQVDVLSNTTHICSQAVSNSCISDTT
jgi:hypothetical protein